MVALVAVQAIPARPIRHRVARGAQALPTAVAVVARVALTAALPFQPSAAQALLVASVLVVAVVVATEVVLVQVVLAAVLAQQAVAPVVQAAPQAHGLQAQTERNGPRLTAQVAVAAGHLPATQVLGALMGAAAAAWRRLARSVPVLPAFSLLHGLAPLLRHQSIVIS